MNWRLSRGPAPRSVISQVKLPSPPQSAGSYADPAETSRVNAADSSHGMGSATRTSPLDRLSA